jgi:hypothetical protein
MTPFSAFPTRLRSGYTASGSDDLRLNKSAFRRLPSVVSIPFTFTFTFTLTLISAPIRADSRATIRFPISAAGNLVKT